LIATAWYLIVGVLLVGMALGRTWLARLPVSTAMLYLVVGIAIGPFGFGLLAIDPLGDTPVLERLTEIAVVVSLFTAGLKLRLAWRDRRWLVPIRLATLSMAITVGLVAVVGVVALGLPLGAAILLGAIVAPTDPVLASDVQVASPGDRDAVRVGLTGEAGLNDGTAFPFVMLGLGLLGLHDLGPLGLRWLAIDVVWASLAGLAVGALTGTLVGRLALRLRQASGASVGAEELLTLGLIALAYGTALLVSGYGFLAVFAAGAALRRVERHATGPDLDPLENPDAPQPVAGDPATDPEHAPAHLAREVLTLNEGFERIAEAGLVVTVGAMLPIAFIPDAVWFVPLLLLAIRPLAVAAGLAGMPVAPAQRRLIGWFGIRGIGSLYYLLYAIAHGLPDQVGGQLATLTLTVVAASAVVHGVSVTPLMAWYERRSGRRTRSVVPD
jgi:NhaP-type Na+/H+ or K+/H+ antiporter